MVYPLSATKLQSYQRCPQAYAFQYEYGLKQGAVFGAAALGQALHQALALIYQDWHYQEPKPAWRWFEAVWQRCCRGLTDRQVAEGWQILHRYYQAFVEPEDCCFTRPLAVEGRIQGEIQEEAIAFRLTGRYDRLDGLDDGLELIDYKSGKTAQPMDAVTIDLQLGVYYLALEQHYGQALKRMSLVYLRTGEKVSFEVTTGHRERVQALIFSLAQQLRADETWQPHSGEHCQRCSYARYCAAVQEEPEPLPEGLKPRPQLQLTLAL
ncbi:MAG: RecB family exonuclease [Prochlorotrichaceae cyanobacterium]|jgi:putative RecB family exonuclease